MVVNRTTPRTTIPLPSRIANGINRPDTLLAGTKIIVDNEDPSITYTGSWARNMDKFVSGSLPSGLPYHNITHQSVTAGDSFSFSITGKRI